MKTKRKNRIIEFKVFYGLVYRQALVLLPGLPCLRLLEKTSDGPVNAATLENFSVCTFGWVETGIVVLMILSIARTSLAWSGVAIEIAWPLRPALPVLPIL
jgi:hypothetical protein